MDAVEKLNGSSVRTRTLEGMKDADMWILPRDRMACLPFSSTVAYAGHCTRRVPIQTNFAGRTNACHLSDDSDQHKLQ